MVWQYSFLLKSILNLARFISILISFIPISIIIPDSILILIHIGKSFDYSSSSNSKYKKIILLIKLKFYFHFIAINKTILMGKKNHFGRMLRSLASVQKIVSQILDTYEKWLDRQLYIEEINIIYNWWLDSYCIQFEQD